MNLLTGLRKIGTKPMLESNSVPPLKRTRVKSWTAGRLLRSRLRPAEEGGALVEMALVLPVFAMLVLGIMSFGVMFMNYIDLTEATGAGAQYLQLIRTSTTDPCQDDLLSDYPGGAQSYSGQPFAQFQPQWHRRKRRHVLRLPVGSVRGNARFGNSEVSVQPSNLRRQLCAHRLPAIGNSDRSMSISREEKRP
jgi:hypothetical protein